MATLTTWLSLVKPSRSDRPDITQISGNWDTLDQQIHNNAVAIAAKSTALVTTSVKTGAYTAGPNEFVLCNPSSAFTVTLPTAAAPGTIVAVRRQTPTSGTFAISVARGGTDTIAGATTAATIALDNEVLWFLKDSASNWNVAAGQKSLSSLDARYTVVYGTTSTTAAVGNDSRITGALQTIETVNTQSTITGTYTIPDVTTATIHRLTLTGNTTFTMPTAAAGKSFSVTCVQDATGSRTATFTGVKWAGATAPTLSTGANKVDDLTFQCTDGSTWKGYLVGLDMR